MTFEIYFLIWFISKMNNKRSGGKIPSFNFISQTLKDIERIYQRKNHDQELISIFRLS